MEQWAQPEPQECFPLFLFLKRFKMIAATTATKMNPTTKFPKFGSHLDGKRFRLAVLLKE